MAGMWARLGADLNCKLRRGAWYRLLKVDGLAALVDVNRKPVPIVRAFLQVSHTPPRRWTVVATPSTARALPPDLGSQYAVCPSCRDRAALHGRPQRLTCRRCNVEFAVDWDEKYLASSR
ncbi:MAG TPA: hypothetical protein VGQ06_01010 [Gemmatimonadales bacterium]|jgi:hypothetical protein|nr:hypothetical protein [Gemmatimonadales bacterium]